ncbi:MAG: rhodanese-related sulfurtransferase [Pseudomonadota bacterium]
MYKVAALYRFVSIDDIAPLQAEIKAACESLDICGTLLLAPEGINGTIGGSEKSIDEIIAFLENKLEISKGEVKFSKADDKPFRRMKVRLKKEIVTLRAPEADPNEKVGTYVEPENWNDLMNDPEITLIDTRNDYETAVGIFKGAIDPDIKTFTEFKSYVKEKMDPSKQKKVAMFCTGGIRCEKASSYMLNEGFEEVYHLKGGILKYLENVPKEESLWDGECFVFDRRVAVGHGLEESPYELCYGCRYPITDEDKQSKSYEKGVSCPHCIDDLTEEKANAFRMRHRQFMQNKEYPESLEKADSKRVKAN